ncbi:hypothetical protein RYX36_005025 [Vicia faba]
MMRYGDRDLEEVKAAIDWGKEETNEKEEDIIVYLSDKKENTFNKKLVPLENSLLTTLFNYRKWNRPLRYIKNDHFERVVRDENSQIFSSKIDSNDNQNSAKPDRNTEFAVVHYSREPDYCRDLIRGSMRPKRRKTVTYKLFQGTAHSPLFLEIMGDYAFLFGDLVYDISQYLKEYIRKPVPSNINGSLFLNFSTTNNCYSPLFQPFSIESSTTSSSHHLCRSTSNNNNNNNKENPLLKIDSFCFIG